MRKIIAASTVISFCLITAFSVYATGKDPYVNKVDRTTVPDKIKLEIDALNNLSEDYLDSTIQVSLELALKALKLAQKIKYGRGESFANVNLGYYYYVKKTYLESLGYFMKALDYARSNNDGFIGNEVNKGMGMIFKDLGRRHRSIEYAKRVLVYAKKKNNLPDLSGAYINLGQLLLEQGDTNEARVLHFNALSLKPRLADLAQQTWILKSVGNFYLSLKQYDNALYYYREALKENPRDLGNLDGTICAIMAHTYEQIDDLDNALYFNRLSLAYRQKENDKTLTTSSLLNIGYTHLRMGAYDSALTYIKRGLRDAEVYKINFLREQGYKYLYNLFLAKREWQKALSVLQTYDTVRAVVELEKNKDQVTLLENNLVVNEKEKQAEKLRVENHLQRLEAKNRNLILLLMISLSVLGIALTIYTYQLLIRNKKAKKIVEEQNEGLQDEIREQEEEFNEIAKQTELLTREVHHRVKNNLSILTSIVNMQKREVTDVKTQDIFSDLQFRVRAMALVHDQLYKSRNIEVLPVGEYLSNLVGIVSSAFTTKNVEVHQDIIEETLGVKITLPLGLIVNELLTNAFKYAFPDGGEGNIWVTWEKAPGTTKSNCEMRRLTVKDDGIGLPVDFDLSQRTSMGSQIIYLLTKQLEGELTIEGAKGASFSILLPLE